MDTPLPSASPDALGISSERLDRVRLALAAEIAARRLPGAVLAIAREGRLACFEAFGELDPSRGVPMTTDALFSVASMTKPIVAAGALTLYEEGRLMLNEPVAKYLPKLAGMRAAPARCAETAGVFTAQIREMTVQDLMRHTCGLTYGNRGTSELLRAYPGSSDWVAEHWSGAEFLERLSALPLHFAPGTAWDYGFGFDVLGLVIEAVAGTPLAPFLEERLFAPLGMKDTGFRVPAEKAARYARALPVDPQTGKPQTLRDATRENKFDCGGGCAVSTAADYLRFAQMLLDGGTLGGARVLSRKAVDYMTSDHIGPEVDATRLREYPNIDGYGFGLGVAVRRGTGGAGMMSTPGEFHWAGSTGTYFWADPAEKLAVVFMAHTPGATRFYMRQLLHAVVLQALR